MATVSMTVDNKITLTLTAKDRAGNPVAFTPASAPTWEVNDATILTVAPAADGISAVVDTVGALGAATVTAHDGDKSYTLDFVISAGAPVSVEIVPGTPEAR